MLARKLQELRKEKGFSQLRLARLAGVSQSNISEIEAGKIIPKVPTAYSDEIDHRVRRIATTCSDNNPTTFRKEWCC